MSVIDMAWSLCLQPFTKFLAYFLNERNRNKHKLLAVNEGIVMKLHLSLLIRRNVIA